MGGWELDHCRLGVVDMNTASWRRIAADLEASIAGLVPATRPNNLRYLPWDMSSTVLLSL
jgi:hypothetical protein